MLPSGRGFMGLRDIAKTVSFNENIALLDVQYML